jgi:hypothetical protein
MIPNVFVSSTIRDLHYLREAIRETVLDLSYNTVMSDFGEVGYLHAAPAASSCYRSVEQCQLFILIIGRRYGSVGEDGVSVTHKEFRTAQQNGIPTITFVEPQVLTYKEVYDSSPENSMWENFPHMDHPHRTFAMLAEVAASPTYNAIIPFHDVADAKRKLKLQIADFVGTYIQDGTRPYRADFKDLLAEIKTLRSQFVHTGRTSTKKREEMQEYLITMRFLLEDRNADYRKFLQGLAGDLDAVIPDLIKATTVEEIVSAMGFKIEFHEEDVFQDFMKDNWQQLKLTAATYGAYGGYATTGTKKVLITQGQFDKFQAAQKALHSKLNNG